MLISSPNKTRGFTIVELLIVIVVIGILAAITTVAYNGIQEKAKVSRAHSDLATLVKAIQVARINEDKTLRQVTGHNCTSCGGLASTYNTTLDRISAASGVNLSALKDGDPWGNRYVLDENEGEPSLANPCTYDGLGVTGASAHPGLVVPRIPLYAC